VWASVVGEASRWLLLVLREVPGGRSTRRAKNVGPFNRCSRFQVAWARGAGSTSLHWDESHRSGATARNSTGLRYLGALATGREWIGSSKPRRGVGTAVVLSGGRAGCSFRSRALAGVCRRDGSRGAVAPPEPTNTYLTPKHEPAPGCLGRQGPRDAYQWGAAVAIIA